jgi:hypothetical protein
MDDEMRVAFESISKQLEQIHDKLVGVEWSLDILRAQPEQDTLQLVFGKTANLTLEKVRSWKKNDRIYLIKEDVDLPLPYRCIVYKHDNLEEEPSVLDSLRLAHGVRHLGWKEQERKLEKLNAAPRNAGQEPKSELEETEQWTSYDFLVGDDESSDEHFAPIKELDMCDDTIRKLISEASQRASRRGADL